MQETPAQFNDHAERRYPAETLSGFRFHTGARLRPLDADEPCGVLFRDIGSEATEIFLRGELQRLAGPFTPLTYMRTADYVEPYTDHERIGRLIFLRPLQLHVWHSGAPTIYVARATRTADPATVGYIPGDIELHTAAALAADAKNTRELREALGGGVYDSACEDARSRLGGLNQELARIEQFAEPVRRRLQSPNEADRDAAKEQLDRLGVTENDLCAAWHHLPLERRQRVKQLAEVDW